MTVQEAISQGAAVISKRWDETPWLDSSVILASVLGVSREKLLASYPEPLSDDNYQIFMEKAAQRAAGSPVAYITEMKEFYGLDFHVDARVLTPRADTEILVEAVQRTAEETLSSGCTPKILDLCTGSGCIAISLKHSIPQCDIWASDISAEALDVARMNQNTLLDSSDKITFIRTDLFAGIDEKFNIIVSNPPYLTTAETTTMKESRWPEPALALDGGADGLDFIRIIIKQAHRNLLPGGSIFFEADPAQMKEIRSVMENNYFSDILIIKDLAGRDRVITGKLIYGKN